MWLPPEETVKKQLEFCFGIFIYQLQIFAGFSPSQGKEREEEVKTGGENFLTAPLALKTTTENPLGFGQSLVLFSSLCPSMDCLIWFSELPPGGRQNSELPQFPSHLPTGGNGWTLTFLGEGGNSSELFWRGAGVSEFLQEGSSILGGETSVRTGIPADCPLGGAIRPRKTEELCSPAPGHHLLITPSGGTPQDAGDPPPQSPGTLRAPNCSVCSQERGDFPRV